MCLIHPCQGRRSIDQPGGYQAEQKPAATAVRGRTGNGNTSVIHCIASREKRYECLAASSAVSLEKTGRNPDRREVPSLNHSLNAKRRAGAVSVAIARAPLFLPQVQPTVTGPRPATGPARRGTMILIVLLVATGRTPAGATGRTPAGATRRATAGTTRRTPAGTAGRAGTLTPRSGFGLIQIHQCRSGIRHARGHKAKQKAATAADTLPFFLAGLFSCMFRHDFLLGSAYGFAAFSCKMAVTEATISFIA